MEVNRIVVFRSISRYSCSVAGEKAAFTGRWVGHTGDLGVVAKRKIAASEGNLMPAVQLLVDHFKEPCRLTAIVSNAQNTLSWRGAL
jgi:hypothetical protein